MGEIFLCNNNLRQKETQQKPNKRQHKDKLVLFVQTLVQKSNADQNTALCKPCCGLVSVTVRNKINLFCHLQKNHDR